MDGFRKFSLILLSIIFIFLTSLTLINESFNKTILKPYKTINYMEDSEIYLDIEKLVEESIQKKIEYMNIDKGIITIIINRSIDELITKELISRISMDIQTSFWDYITDKTDTIVAVSLVEFNNKLNEFYEKEIINLVDSNYNFKNIFYPQIENLLIETFEVNQYITDHIGYAENAKKYYQLLKILEIYIYLTLAFILLLVFLIFLNIRKTANWLGINIIITGLITFTTALLFNLIDKQIIYNQIDCFHSVSGLEYSIYDVINIIVKDISTNLIGFSVIILVAGVLLLLLSKLLIKRDYKLKASN